MLTLFSMENQMVQCNLLVSLFYYRYTGTNMAMLCRMETTLITHALLMSTSAQNNTS